MRPWLERLGPSPSLDALNAAAEQVGLETAGGQPVRFVPPGKADPYYEIHLYETGQVQTRPDNLHDRFNALAWLAFPRTKALINALHAEEMPREGGRRGRRRDLLTLIDEGGVVVQCNDAELISLLTSFQWKELFWARREQVKRGMRFLVLGHATLEQAALAPRPGIACKAMIVPYNSPADAAAHAWLAALPGHPDPKDVPPVPVFGYPGWLAESERVEFYEDTRYFRPRRAVESGRESAGQPLPRSPAER